MFKLYYYLLLKLSLFTTIACNNLFYKIIIIANTIIIGFDNTSDNKQTGKNLLWENYKNSIHQFLM